MHHEPTSRTALYSVLVEQDHPAHAARRRAEEDKARKVLHFALAFGLWGPALLWLCSRLL